MARDEPVTRENDGDVAAFLSSVPDERRRADALALLPLMERATGQPPRLWGTSIVGFGRYHYTYATGREGDAAAVGFSPRKANLTVYFPMGFDDLQDDLARLGPHTTSVSCLYLKRLDDVDLEVLEGMVRRGYRQAVDHVWG
ncbi:DUF1801 domain-containing protein [Cellulomonas carbonis]|uniref:YdhG-like domain-containing protein n=1 Tax=Cellulomonas carbonis T26 TaxID=947969 RepID=A0A0A0BXY5_9CELL|nr:DUF1801 domain-containing protein [Cellulomonas carbonis]KGM12567.1 hypothetical protein N868_09885 [Cellulomonas carbonis T26]